MHAQGGGRSGVPGSAGSGADPRVRPVPARDPRRRARMKAVHAGSPAARSPAPGRLRVRGQGEGEGKTCRYLRVGIQTSRCRISRWSSATPGSYPKVEVPASLKSSLHSGVDGTPGAHAGQRAPGRGGYSYFGTDLSIRSDLMRVELRIVHRITPPPGPWPLPRGLNSRCRTGPARRRRRTRHPPSSWPGQTSPGSRADRPQVPSRGGYMLWGVDSGEIRLSSELPHTERAHRRRGLSRRSAGSYSPGPWAGAALVSVSTGCTDASGIHAMSPCSALAPRARTNSMDDKRFR